MPRPRFVALLILLLALLLSTGGHTSAQTRPDLTSFLTQEQQRTAQILTTVDAPSRDLVALTRQLKLKGDPNIPSVVNPTPPDYPAGTRHQFYVADVLNNNYYTIAATLHVVTEHAYWYVRDGYRVDLAALRASANRFETHIYPTTRRIFGAEADPGIDNDPRITVLITPMQGIGGYFSASDTYPTIVNPYSNQRDMIYLSIVPRGRSGDARNAFEATLAHEFQHMVHWNTHRDRDVWLDEGCAQLAELFNGYDASGAGNAFMRNPDTQLNSWAEPPNNVAHYGAAYLFLRYLTDRYGGQGFVSNLVKQEGLSVQAIDAAVKQAGNPAGFEGAFKDWTVANVLNDPSLAGGRYSYSEGGRAQTRLVQTYPATVRDTVGQHAADYIRLAGSLGPATITFRGSSTARVVGADAKSGRAYWYSNRRDLGDATLTRELDLTSVSKATLTFWTWFHIEEHYDYAYAQASTDGGQTWDILKGRYTTTDNPNGASFGHAWTAKSGAAYKSNDPARWVEESVDLSAYAGKRVLVRFQYITDEGYNAPGFAVDDIRVPEIGYVDNAEADNAWSAQGFIRVGSRLPQRWYVALIEKGSPNRVREMVVSANGVGTLNLAGIGGSRAVREAVLVIVPLAPKTTERANYTVTVRR